MGDLEAGLLEWAGRQAEWQRDILRRLAGGEILAAADFREYANEAMRLELSKETSWHKEPDLASSPVYMPLAAPHLAATIVGGEPVVVSRLTHLEGVNDLAAGAILEFAPTGLTIIAGSNGTGKSGYTRIFKQVAATRASEQVVPNAFNPSVTPRAVVTYQVGTGAPLTDLTWESGAAKEESPMQRVRVFDTRAALVHLAGATEIAYVPTSLKIMSAYTSVLQEIAALIDADARNERLKQHSWPTLESGKGLTLIEVLGTAEALDLLAEFKSLTDDEIEELAELPSRIADLTTSDPAARSVQARQRAAQLRTLANSLGSIAQKLTFAAVDESRRIRDELASARTQAEKAQLVFDGADVLPGTGNEEWQAMWSAAGVFLENDEHDHQAQGDLDQCPLCVQPLAAEAKQRFELFKKFMGNEAQAALQAAARLRASDVEALKSLPLSTLVTQDLVALVATYDQVVGASLLSLVRDATAWRDELTADMNLGADIEPGEGSSVAGADNMERDGATLVDLKVLAATFSSAIGALRQAAKSEEDAAEALADTDGSALAVSQLTARRDTLSLRVGIHDARDALGAQHDRILRAARYDAAKAACSTSSASRKNSDLSQGYITTVCTKFETEAVALGLKRVPVEMAFDRSSKGISYIKVGLKGASQVAVSSVLSEGEQRVTAIAGFFADLTESGDESTLVFDDPVSSLDQEFRVRVAQRLLEEAEKRQVLVFTHDFSFVQYLYEEKILRDKVRLAAGKKPHPDLNYRHIARTPAGAGSVTDAEVWRHVSIKERIGRLKSRQQAAAALHRKNDLIAYEKEARDIVGAIRESWEVFVEQELLNGVVTRHERSVQTQRLSKVTDLTDADIATVDLGMTIESRYMTGHAAPATDGSPPQEPEWLSDEIGRLENYRKGVLGRR